MALTHQVEKRNRRRFIRHPSQIPLTCNRAGHRDDSIKALRDISHGGLRFVAGGAYPPGDIVDVSFPALPHAASLRGEIVWNGSLEDDPARRVEHGMRFLNEDMRERARVVEQICHIEAYRQAQERDHGRYLTSNEAAAEWIARSAGRFPYARRETAGE